MKYSINPFRSLLLLDNNYSFSPVSNGFVSLNPKSDGALIPAYAKSSGKNEFNAKFLPTDRNQSSKLDACSAKLFAGKFIYDNANLDSFFNKVCTAYYCNFIKK